MNTTSALALGANKTAPLLHLKEAVRRIKTHPEIHLISESPWFESVPRECPPGSPAFINGVVVIDTMLSPWDLLAFTQGLEHHAGREALSDRLRNAPRVLDVDILFYGEMLLNMPELILPHPRMHERRFVLEPLAYCLPDWKDPLAGGKTVSELLRDLPAGEPSLRLLP